MQKTILFFSFIIGCCFSIFSQSQICVDGNSGNTGDGSPTNPYRTIQEAVIKASNGDIIKVAKGTYSEAVQIVNKKVQLLGGFAGNGDFSSANPQENKTTIKGTNTAPCIFVSIQGAAISGTLIINGFTICDGERGIELADGWSESMDNITIENNIIENNGIHGTPNNPPSLGGGGIGLGGSNITIKNNVIRNNAAGRGAAIGRTDKRIVNFLIDGNLIQNNKGYDNHAGGVDICGKGTITKNFFDGNVTGLSYDYGWGGAILTVNEAIEDPTMLITLSYNIYHSNYAPSRGGAVFVDDGSNVEMNHELLYNNTTTKESGSAIYVDADGNKRPSVLNMNNCTVWGNSTTNSPNGAAIFVQGSTTHIQDCIFWNNGNDFESIDDGQVALLTVNYTLTQQGFAGTGNISSDPLFADAANGDFHLKSKGGRFSLSGWINDSEHSPAIDAGNPSSDYSNEPEPNGNRINLGRYGNTTEASKSTGSEKIEENTQTLWTISPNPAKESITISNLTNGSNITITNITGKKVYTSVIENEQTTINTANFENGIYIIQITNNGTVANKKFVVNK